VDCSPDERAKPLVIVGHDQLHATQAAVGQSAEEVRPEHLGFGMTGVDAQHFAAAVLVHAHGDYHGAADNPSGIADTNAGGVQP
jgi:hypothetical protein